MTRLGRTRQGNPGRFNELRFSFDLSQARTRLVSWYRQEGRDLPWRRLWLEHRDPYHVWISEVMLQQTVIKAVIPAYERFLKRFPKIDDLALASEDSLRETVRGLGYYRRFGLMLKAAKVIQATGWPRDAIGLKALPGIGDYTAAAISSIAFNYPAAVVDGNVERVFCRLLDLRVPANDPQLKPPFKGLAQSFLDREDPSAFNQGIMELGQRICTPLNPNCTLCPIAEGCLARQRGSQADAPQPKLKAGYQDLALDLFVVAEGPRIGVFERPGTARFLKGSWGFLTAVHGADGVARLDGHDLEVPLVELATVGQIRHSITHHRIRAQVILTEFPRATKGALPVRWLKPSELDAGLVASLDRKAWQLAAAYLETSTRLQGDPS